MTCGIGFSKTIHHPTKQGPPLLAHSSESISRPLKNNNRLHICDLSFTNDKDNCNLKGIFSLSPQSDISKQAEIIMCKMSQSTHISLSVRKPLNKVYMSKQAMEENGNHLY